MYFSFCKNAFSALRSPWSPKICVAANGAMRFSVRSFGCALFYLEVFSMEKLFANPGKKLKIVAIILFLLLLVGGTILATIYAVDEEDISTFLTIFISALASSWLLALPLYAFGEVVENSAKIVQNTSKDIAE